MSLFKFTFFFCLASSFALHAQNDCTPYINTAPLFSGKKTEYYDNRNKKSERNYKNEKLDGEYIRFYENGKMQSLHHYKDDYMQGSFKTFYESGKAESTGNYYYGRLSGNFSSWYENGVLKSQLVYKDGSINGDYVYYYINGNVQAIYKLKRGTKESEYIKYYKNGQMEYKIPHEDGVFVGTGVFSCFWENGKVKCKAEYSDGNCSGTIELYDQQGRLAEKLGNPGKGLRARIEYHENGNVKAVSEISLNQFVYYDCDNINFSTVGEKLNFDEHEQLASRELFYAGYLVFSTGFKDGLKAWNLNFDKSLKEDLNTDSATYNPLVTGRLLNGNTYYTDIRDVYGNTLVKKGNGSFFDFYYYVSDWDLYPVKSHKYKPLYGTFGNMCSKGLFYVEWEDFLSLLDDRVYGEGRYYYSAPNYAKGKIHHGLKQGKWYEGDFCRESGRTVYFAQDGYKKLKRKMDLEKPSATYAYGNYTNGKKEGPWKLVTTNYEVYGAYANGKKEGKWIATGRKLREEYKNYFTDENGNLLDYTNKLLIEAFYRNGLPDSLWTVYDKEKLTKQKVMLYRRGQYIGVLQEFYSSGKIKIKGELKGDSIVKTYFSPLGDLITKFDESSGLQKYVALKNGKKEGRYYSWDNSGNIIQLGMYLNDQSNGEWLLFGDHNDTISLIDYKANKMHGRFINKNYGRVSYGMYKENEKTGLWVDSTSRDKVVINYKNGKDYLLEYKKEYITSVINGKGLVVEEEHNKTFHSPYDVAKTESYYEQGLVVRKKEYYQGNRFKSETIFTNHGDSLISHNSPWGGICVSNGDGNVTELDEDKRIIKITYYENGRVQRMEFYDKGKFRYTQAHFPSKYDLMPELYRTITTLGNGNYKVEYRLSKLKGTSGSLSLTEILPVSYEVKKIVPGTFRYAGVLTTVKEFLWAEYNEEDDLFCSYLVKIPNGEAFNAQFPASLHYVKNDAPLEVKLDPKNVLVN